MWWPGTELNRRRQPFQGFNQPISLIGQLLNLSRWPQFCDHSVTSADVRLKASAETRFPAFRLGVHGAKCHNPQLKPLLQLTTYWSEGEVLKWAGVGTEVEKVACEGVAARMDGRRWYERGSGVRMGSGARRTGAERGEPCRVFELWANTSCRRSHQQRGRTELDLSSGQSFDNCHGPTALGAAPKRRLLGGGGCWFGLQWSCTQCCEAKRQ